MSKLKIFISWVVAVLISSITASLTSSIQVQNKLIDIGAQIDIQTRLTTSIRDLALLEALVPLLAIAFLIAFSVASQCHKRFSGSRSLWFSIAGGTSFFTMLTIMAWVFSLMPIAGARTTSGMIAMSLCGALGGWVYVKLAQTLTAQ